MYNAKRLGVTRRSIDQRQSALEDKWRDFKALQDPE
jgi:hypothetical protein